MHILARPFYLFLLCLFSFTAFSQDATIYNWSVSSKRIDASTYELTFHTTGNPSWQLYGPNEVLSEVPATTVEFDSSITADKTFKDSGDVKVIMSSLFDNQKVNIHEGAAAFTATIHFKDVVPAKLLGKLLYTYGKGDEFYPGNVYAFTVELEGGVRIVGTHEDQQPRS